MPPSSHSDGVVRARKRPVEVEAIQWTGENFDAVYEFADRYTATVGYGSGCFHLPTLEGIMTARRGDWIIRGIEGEVYPCKPEIFAKTYEVVRS